MDEHGEQPDVRGGLNPKLQGGDDQALQQGHPNHPKAMRVQALLMAFPALLGAIAAEYATPFWPFAILGPVALILAVLVIFLPHRRYAARGHALSDDRLRVVRGLLFRSDTVVPFGRVQHIDVAQGPLERFFGIATLTVHTAGNHNASVALPGLGELLAREMRETIRAHIRRETV